MEYMDEHHLFFEYYLKALMDSPEGGQLRKSLENTIADEERCLNEFKKMISHCQGQLSLIAKSIFENGPSKVMMAKKRAFEEEQIILNIAALAQQCSFETKGFQLLLYFEKNENTQARIIANVSVMMYEWCEKLLGLSGKQLQDIAKRLVTQNHVVQINVARKRVSDFYKNEKPTLSEIRNNVGAHRDQDFMKQMDVIDSLSWSDTLERFHEFEKATLAFGEALKPLMDAGLKQIGAAFEGV